MGKLDPRKSALDEMHLLEEEDNPNPDDDRRFDATDSKKREELRKVSPLFARPSWCLRFVVAFVLLVTLLYVLFAGAGTRIGGWRTSQDDRVFQGQHVRF